MNNFQNSINIEIAEFTINLCSDQNIELEEGYSHFISNKKTKNADITIQCFNEFPVETFKKKDLVFEAKNDTQNFYSIYRLENEFGFEIFNQQQQIGDIQQIAIADDSFTNWKIYTKSTSDNNVFPLKYPMGPIIMHYLTIKSDAVMMHASCAYDGVNARLFSGFSGAGKSTISKIWSEAGTIIINDDRLIIRKMGNQFFAYNTPMYYKDVSKKAPLSSIFLISHSPENRINKLTGAIAISKVMAFCIQNNFDKQFINSRLDFFSDLCRQIPVYGLGFVPDKSVVNFILENETKGI